MHSSSHGKARGTLGQLQADFCRGMAHPTRICILESLQTGEKTVNELSRIAGVTQANTSQHLALLRQFGLVSTRRDGTSIYYSISDERITEACRILRSCIEDKLNGQVALAGLLPRQITQTHSL